MNALISRVRTFPEILIQCLVLLALFLFGYTTIPGLGSQVSLLSITILAGLLGIAACGQTLVVLLSGVDLSVPSVIGASTLLAADLLNEGHSFTQTAFICLGTALAVGVLNGVLVTYFEVPALIGTLAVGAMTLGVALVITGNSDGAGVAPEWLSKAASPVATTGPVGIPPLVVFWIVVAIAMAIFLGKTASGFRIYATGANRKAAALAGVKIHRITIGAYAVSALSAGILGLILFGYVGSGNPDIGSAYLFTSIAAVLVGGNSLAGGQGDYWRTVLGAFIITMISVLLIGYNRGSADQQVLTGLLILAAATLYGRERRVGDLV